MMSNNVFVQPLGGDVVPQPIEYNTTRHRPSFERFIAVLYTERVQHPQFGWIM